MNVQSACMPTTCMQCHNMPEEGITSPGTVGTNGCEPLCGFREMNLGILHHSAISLTPVYIL